MPELLAALTALKRGDFSVRLPVHWSGLAGKTADTFNEVVELNERMAQEFARLRQVVGREGRIGQRASLGDVSGTWADSVGLVNELITDLVQPTSEMARVIGAVAKGDLSQTMAMDLDGRPLEGEFLRTARTVNTMVDQLGSFASEVTRVAREVGTEGKLGGQADVKGVAGTWKDLTDSVNLMASNLTGQVRNIAEVTTAVANGDLGKKDHRRCERRVPRTQGHHQYDGGPVALVCFGGDPRGAGGGYGGQAGWPGGCARGLGHVEGFDRQRQLHGQQSDRTGAQHRRGDDGGRHGRSFAQDHGRCAEARFWS